MMEAAWSQDPWTVILDGGSVMEAAWSQDPWTVIR